MGSIYIPEFLLKNLQKIAIHDILEIDGGDINGE